MEEVVDSSDGVRVRRLRQVLMKATETMLADVSADDAANCFTGASSSQKKQIGHTYEQFQVYLRQSVEHEFELILQEEKNVRDSLNTLDALVGTSSSAENKVPSGNLNTPAGRVAAHMIAAKSAERDRLKAQLEEIRRANGRVTGEIEVKRQLYADSRALLERKTAVLDSATAACAALQT